MKAETTRKFVRLSLRWKMILSVLVVAIVGSAYMAFVEFPKVASKNKEWLEIQLNNEVESVIESLVPYMLQNDLAGIWDTLNAVGERSPEWILLELYEGSGKRIYPLNTKSVIENDTTLIIEKDIVFFNENIGRIRVVVAIEEQLDQLNDILLFYIELVLLGIFLGCVVIFFWFDRILTRPVLALSQASKNMAIGDFSSVLPDPSHDEIGDLVANFDRMRNDINIAQNDLMGARDDAESANQAKSEFLSRMSHELRTPLNAILGFSQMLKWDEDGFTETQQSNIEEINDAGRHLLDLINDVLDLATIESGKMNMEMSKVSVPKVIQQSLTLIATQAADRNISIEDKISGTDYCVHADVTRFKQVLVNILTNAVKYNRDNGTIIVNCEATDEDRLCISVRDTGMGMSEDELELLFTSFERLDMTNNVEGTGIGLVITKHLVELMGGTIGVESVVGEGSVFWIEFALVDR